jgi:predicted component of type VI protein secretion system
MSALTAAQARVGSALDRLEQALRTPAGLAAPPDQDLRLECEQLRRELAAAIARADRLAAVLSEAEGRVDGAIDRIDELSGSRIAP